MLFSTAYLGKCILLLSREDVKHLLSYIGSGYGLVLSGNKPEPGPKLTNVCVTRRPWVIYSLII